MQPISSQTQTSRANPWSRTGFLSASFTMRRSTEAFSGCDRITCSKYGPISWQKLTARR